MKNQLQGYFSLFIIVSIFFVLLFTLFGPEGKSIDLKEINFSTTSSSELYFKNMRSYFYDKENREDANFILYRIDSRELDSSKNKLSFVLISNWLQSESYIIAESKFDSIKVVWEYGEVVGDITLRGKDSESNYLFAAQLFEQLDRKATLFISDNDLIVPFSEQEQSSLRTTLKDYFKLVGKIR